VAVKVLAGASKGQIRLGEEEDWVPNLSRIVASRTKVGKMANTRPGFNG
jgi:hypothetical protein